MKQKKKPHTQPIDGVMYSFPPLLITVADRLNSEICVVKAPPTVQPDIPTSRSISDDTVN